MKKHLTEKQFRQGEREREKTLTIFGKHQKRIALQTLKMHDLGASIMGGMSKDEARAFLRSIGYTEKQILNLESV